MGLHLLAKLDAPRPEHEVRRGVDHPHERPEEDHEDPQGAADPQRGRLGTLDREVLGRLLPEDEVRVGYDREPHDEGDDAHYALVGYASGPEERLDEVGHGRLAYPPEAQGCHRDPDLAHGEVAVEVPQSVAHHPRPNTTLLLELLDARSRTRTRANSAATKKPLRPTRNRASNRLSEDKKGSSKSMNHAGGAASPRASGIGEERFVHHVTKTIIP